MDTLHVIFTVAVKCNDYYVTHYLFTYCALDNGLTLTHFRLCTFICIYVQRMTRTGIRITSFTEFTVSYSVCLIYK